MIDACAMLAILCNSQVPSALRLRSERLMLLLMLLHLSSLHRHLATQHIAGVTVQLRRTRLTGAARDDYCHSPNNSDKLT